MESIVKHMEASPKFHPEITPRFKTNGDGCAAGSRGRSDSLLEGNSMVGIDVRQEAGDEVTPCLKGTVWLNKALAVKLTWNKGPLRKISLQRNEEYIKLCLIYGISMLLTSKCKVSFPWPSLSLMYHLSVTGMLSEHNSYGNISVPTATLLHPWNPVIFKSPHC